VGLTVAAAPRVLVVDDDALMLTFVSQILARQGFEVLPASGPRQALETVRTTPPIQLILSDVSMPAMRGTQLVSEVFRLSPQTTGLLMTGDIDSLPDVPEGVAVLRKPFSFAKHCRFGDRSRSAPRKPRSSRLHRFRTIDPTYNPRASPIKYRKCRPSGRSDGKA
jgi:DNA-binding NtrC family response regulator